MKDAKVTIEKVEDKGQYKARVTIEILNPIPKSAKFFQQVNPTMVVLDGTHNKIWKHFNTEKQGREWADEMLLAVMRKSWEEVRKYQEITDTSVDIKFHYDHYTPSLLQKEEPVCFGEYEECKKFFLFKSGDNLCPFISLCKDAPKCIGKYPHNNGLIECCECPEPYFNMCNNIVTETKKKKPDCFGEHSSACSACVSKISLQRCFGQYAQCQNSSSKGIRGCSFMPLCKCYQDSEEEKIVECRKDSPDKEIADVMIKKGMNWRVYHDKHNIIYFPTFQACIGSILDGDPAMLSSHQIEEYDKGSDEWREWKSVLGKTISHIKD